MMFTATIETARGKIVCELFPKEAPQSVNSFVFLALNGLEHRDRQDFFCHVRKL